MKRGFGIPALKDSLRIDVNGHRHSARGEIEELLAVAAPERSSSAVFRNHPLPGDLRATRSGRRTVERPDVDFVFARFVGLVGDPTAVRRKTAEGLVEGGLLEDERFAAAWTVSEWQDPHVSGRNRVVKEEEAPVGRPTACKLLAVGLEQELFVTREIRGLLVQVESRVLQFANAILLPPGDQTGFASQPEPNVNRVVTPRAKS